MAYLDLIMRSVTEPGLIQVIVKFLLDTEKFDGQRILDVLVERLNSNDARVCPCRRLKNSLYSQTNLSYFPALYGYTVLI